MSRKLPRFPPLDYINTLIFDSYSNMQCTNLCGSKFSKKYQNGCSIPEPKVKELFNCLFTLKKFQIFCYTTPENLVLRSLTKKLH